MEAKLVLHLLSRLVIISGKCTGLRQLCVCLVFYHCELQPSAVNGILYILYFIFNGIRTKTYTFPLAKQAKHFISTQEDRLIQL